MGMGWEWDRNGMGWEMRHESWQALVHRVHALADMGRHGQGQNRGLVGQGRVKQEKGRAAGRGALIGVTKVANP